MRLPAEVGNRVLDALPTSEYRRLIMRMRPVELPRGKVLYNAGDRAEAVGAVRSDGVIVVSEAFNDAPGQSAASSYQVLANGNLQVISGSVHETQTAGCWIISPL